MPTGLRRTVAWTSTENVVGASTGVSQVVQGVQVIGGNLTIATGNVHHHEYYIMAEASVPSVLDHVSNFRGIQITTLGKATPGTGIWLLRWDKFILWLDLDGWLRILWGSGMRKPNYFLVLANNLKTNCSRCGQDNPSVS